MREGEQREKGRGGGETIKERGAKVGETEEGGKRERVNR